MGYVDPIPELKREIALAIVGRLKGWIQIEMAAIIGTDQPRVSDLRNGDLERFSLDRLVRMASRAGGTVRLDVKWERLRYL